MRRNQSLRVYSKGTLGKFAIFFTVLLNACVEDSNNYLGSDVADEAAYNTTIASNAVSNNSGSNKAGSNNAAPGDSAPSIEIISTTQPSVSESTPNVRPSISLSSPSDNADYPVSNDILVSVSASDSDGTVLQVDFYENDRLLGTDTSSPYAFNWRNPTVGSHNIHAVAIDNEGLTAESATHRIFVNEDDPDPEAPSVSEPAPEVRPTITLDSPGDNANYVEGTNIRLSTSASDSDGSVQHVEFYENGALLGADASRPFLFDWTRATVGSHDIHAVAVDNEGLTVESATHRIFVNEAGTTANSASLTIYPATQAIQDQFMSDRFAVRLSQNASTHSSFVYQSDNDANPNWAGTLDYMQAANHWTTFSFEGSVDIEASRLDGNTIRTCVVVPQALNIQTRIQGNSCHFTLNHPAKVSVEIDE
ncbi:MAG: hypothetical protein KZQ78_04405, partial [Candidatus Thiodiazotropha sp. (ex Ustalcina ferruginea)]|nr:hypothetical protein [Candidatus Thiodiazotropha sp. (ex Ustalcina ferruginea)]